VHLLELAPRVLSLKVKTFSLLLVYYYPSKTIPYYRIKNAPKGAFSILLINF
jgi:hypothetical protein